MIEHQPWDPVGHHITELREDSAVAAIVGANPAVARPEDRRVRGQEPDPGDGQGPGAYRAFIVLVTLPMPPHPQVPIQTARHVVRCYGRDRIEADRLARAAQAVFHRQGPRAGSGGQWIYVTHDVSGASYSTDPDTGQPQYTFIVETVATTQVVA